MPQTEIVVGKPSIPFPSSLPPTSSCQQLFEDALGLREDGGGKVFDLLRSFAVFIEGLVFTGPGLHFLYGALENMVPSQSNPWAALLHVLADELLFDPLFVLGFFLLCGVLEGKHLVNEVIPQVQEEYWPALKGGWVVSVLFLPLEFCTFRYLPVQFRVLVVNLTDVVWTAVVSYFAHWDRKKQGHHQNTLVPTAVVA